MGIRLIAVAGLGLLMSAASAGCSSLGCDSYMSKDEMLDTWIGANLREYESAHNRRPVDTMVRPQNRTEYTYVSHDEWISGTHYVCYDRLEADNTTGEIVGWSYEGTHCVGRCVG